jgi:hypothetical protein
MDLVEINPILDIAIKTAKDRLQNYLIFCFQNTQSFKGFWKQFRSSYFVTIPKLAVELTLSALGKSVL